MCQEKITKSGFTSCNFFCKFLYLFQAIQYIHDLLGGHIFGWTTFSHDKFATTTTRERENDKLLTAISSTAGTLTLPPGLIFRVYSATCEWMRDFHTPARLFCCITYAKK